MENFTFCAVHMVSNMLIEEWKELQNWWLVLKVVTQYYKFKSEATLKVSCYYIIFYLYIYLSIPVFLVAVVVISMPCCEFSRKFGCKEDIYFEFKSKGLFTSEPRRNNKRDWKTNNKLKNLLLRLYEAGTFFIMSQLGGSLDNWNNIFHLNIIRTCTKRILL